MKKYELDVLLSDLGVIEKNYVKLEDVTKENEANIIKIDGYNYTFDNCELSTEQISLALAAKQAKDVKSIKSMVIFFVIIAVASFVLSIIAIL